MKPVAIASSMKIGLRGSVEFSIFDEYGVKQRCSEHNEICDSSIAIILGLLSRDIDNKIVSKIGVGTGGDLDPDTLLDTGARVPPRDDEEHMRQPIFEISIANVESDDDKIIYTAVARQEDSNSDLINEFGLLSEDGTMMAHFITPADMSGRAERYTKTPLLFMVVRWTLYPTVVRT